MKEQCTNTYLDIKIALAVVICFISATWLSLAGIKFFYGEVQLEILQRMTACIACLLCCQENTEISKNAGINRLIITAIGGGAGILAVLLDDWIQNGLFLILLIAGGVFLTLIICRAVKVPYINARIGGVTFILVTCTMTHNARIWYAAFRLLSTFYGVVVVLVITWIFDRVMPADIN